jgi:hypothetical protein
MQMYGGVGVQLHALLTPAADGRESLVLHPCHFISEEGQPILGKEAGVGYIRSGRCGKRKILTRRALNPLGVNEVFYKWGCEDVDLTNTRVQGRAMAQVVSRRPLTAEARVRDRVNPYGICGGQSGTGTGFSPSSSVSPVNISFHCRSPNSYHLGNA